MKKFSVIIPAYNEEFRITQTLQDINTFLERQNFEYEILVINDGSKDNTSAVVQKLSQDIKNLRLISNSVNRGKGWVVKRGMLEADGDVRLFMDADNSTTIGQVVPMLGYLEQGYDAVIGSIEIGGAKVNEKAQWYRRAFGHWSKFLIRIVAGLWDIKDTQRGFKVFSEKAAQEIFSRVTVDGFGFDVEVLAIAKLFGFKIKELPVVWNNASGSTVSLKSYFGVLLDLFYVRWNLWAGKYKTVNITKTAFNPER